MQYQINYPNPFENLLVNVLNFLSFLVGLAKLGEDSQAF